MNTMKRTKNRNLEMLVNRAGGETETWKNLDGMVSKKERLVTKGLGVEKWRVL